MSTNSRPIDIHEAAARMAVACRRLIQACLREEEWRDAGMEFYRVIRRGLEDFLEGDGRCSRGAP